MDKALELGRMKWMSENQKLPQDSDVEYHLKNLCSSKYSSVKK